MALATSQIALAFQAQQMGRRRRRRLRRPPAWLHPRQIERAFAAQLGAMALDFIRQVREVILPALPSIESQARSEQGRMDSTRTDAWFDRIAPLLEALRISATGRDRTVSAGAIDIGQKTSKWNDKEWQKILRKTVGVGLLTAEPGLRDQLRLFAQTNANLITKLQADKIAEIRGVIERGFAQGLRHTEVAKQVMEKVNTTKTRARLIARDQVSKLNGRLTQMRQEEAGISKYIWQTAEDSRVRATHSPMDGKLGRWDNASLYANVSEPNKWLAKSGINAVELHPGQDILCRCFAEPFIQELAPETEEKPAPKTKTEEEAAAGQASKFRPADDVDGAYEWANTQGLLPENADRSDYDTANVAVANTLNRSLFRMKQKGYKMPPNVSIDSKGLGLTQWQSRNVPAGFSIESGRIAGLVVNPEAAYWKDVAGEAKKMRDVKHWASPLTTGPIDHEFGHWLHFDKNRTNYFRQSRGPGSKLSAASKFLAADEVSKYASTSPLEFVAETFAGAQGGRALSPGVMRLYDSLGGPKIK